MSMNELSMAPVLIALIAGQSPLLLSGKAAAGCLPVHRAVPMFVHGFVPIPKPQCTYVRREGLGVKSVGERSNGGRSVGRPSRAKDAAGIRV